MTRNNMPLSLSSLDAVPSGRVIVLDEETLERIERPTSRLEAVVYDISAQITGVDSENSDDAEE